MSAKDHPPSTNGSPRLARRALTTSLAALGAVVAPVALVAATAGMPSTGTSPAAASSSRAFAAEAHLVRSQADSRAVAFRADAPAATPATVVVPTTAAPTTTAPPPPPPTTAPPRPKPAPVAAPSGSGNGDPNDPASWDRLAQCESSGNWAANTGNGYYGGLQFALSSWRAVGGQGYPHEASRETQIEMGKRLYNQGGWSHWPGCTRSFGWPQ
jgi:hypothetical protein